MKTVFSGIQPTGVLHIGNYLGAIKNWKRIIKNSNHRFFFSIVDLHAITVYQKPEELRESILSTFALYLACGIAGKNVVVFQQSAVKQHAELAWVLSCNTPLGWLDRMIQYKDKTAEHKERACLGLYSYPILMAADILLYQTDIVPVGEDQKQHIELTRDIAIRFNEKYGNVFNVPAAEIQSETKRIMSLKDGTKKMSKSDDSDLSRINILDDEATIVNKIKKAKGGDIHSPEMRNLLGLYYAFTGKNYDVNLAMEKTGVFKQELANAITKELLPIQTKYYKLMEDRQSLERKLKSYNKKAQLVADENIRNIFAKIGIL